MNFPLDSFTSVSASNLWTYLVFGVIGFAFGYVLETSGFGNSKKLAAQFYFKDLTVLKVMFTAIVVAMVLLFGAVGLGVLDFGQVWVNPTYLASGVVGGLIMGVGFIIGGFCPGTTVAATATGKIDGMFYLLGGFFGAYLFGETEQYFTYWYNNAGYYGRLTLDQVFNLPVGVVVLLVVLMALFMFWGAEQMERLIGKKDLSREPKWRIAAAGALFVTALAVLLIGSPSTEERYANVEFTSEIDGQTVLLSADDMLAQRLVHVSPAELFSTVYNQSIHLTLLDVRPESEYNLYHINGARNVSLTTLPALVPDLLAEPPANSVVVLMSNDELGATQAWRQLVAASVPNTYILEGGLNGWIEFFGKDESFEPIASLDGDQPGYLFPAALGSRYESCDPNPVHYEGLEFVPRIQLELRRDKSGGGCG